MLSLSVLFLVKQGCGGAWRSDRSKNKRNSDNHEVGENDGNTFIFITFICLFIYLSSIF